jgi:hypothetical protein
LSGFVVWSIALLKVILTLDLLVIVAMILGAHSGLETPVRLVVVLLSPRYAQGHIRQFRGHLQYVREGAVPYHLPLPILRRVLILLLLSGRLTHHCR